MSVSEKALQRKLDNARAAASWLKEHGQPFHAEQVLMLCRSAEGLRSTCALLHADLGKARAAQ